MKKTTNLFKAAQKTLLTVLSFCMVLGLNAIRIKFGKWGKGDNGYQISI